MKLDLSEKRPSPDRILAKRLRILDHWYPLPMYANDPLFLFGNVPSQVTFIHSPEVTLQLALCLDNDDTRVDAEV